MDYNELLDRISSIEDAITSLSRQVERIDKVQARLLGEIDF